MKMAIRKNIHNLSQGPPNPGFMQEKVQKGDFLKKTSQELIFFLLLQAVCSQHIVLYMTGDIAECDDDKLT